MSNEMVDFYLIYGERVVKRSQPNKTPLAELKKIATEQFGVEDPVLLYYDTEDEEWLRAPRRFTLRDKDQLKVVRTDENGKIIDTNKCTNDSSNKQPRSALEVKELDTACICTAKYGGSDPFTEKPQVEQLEKLLSDYEYMYDRIGRVLGLDFAARQKICVDSVYLGCERKMQATIKKWKEIKKDATWNDIIRAVKEDQLNKLALDIETYLKKSCKNPKCCQ